MADLAFNRFDPDNSHKTRLDLTKISSRDSREKAQEYLDDATFFAEYLPRISATQLSNDPEEGAKNASSGSRSHRTRSTRALSCPHEAQQHIHDLKSPVTTAMHQQENVRVAYSQIINAGTPLFQKPGGQFDTESQENCIASKSLASDTRRDFPKESFPPPLIQTGVFDNTGITSAWCRNSPPVELLHRRSQMSNLGTREGAETGIHSSSSICGDKSIAASPWLSPICQPQPELGTEAVQPRLLAPEKAMKVETVHQNTMRSSPPPQLNLGMFSRLSYRSEEEDCVHRLRRPSIAENSTLLPMNRTPKAKEVHHCMPLRLSSALVPTKLSDSAKVIEQANSLVCNHPAPNSDGPPFLDEHENEQLCSGNTTNIIPTIQPVLHDTFGFRNLNISRGSANRFLDAQAQPALRQQPHSVEEFATGATHGESMQEYIQRIEMEMSDTTKDELDVEDGGLRDLPCAIGDTLTSFAYDASLNGDLLISNASSCEFERNYPTEYPARVERSTLQTPFAPGFEYHGVWFDESIQHLQSPQMTQFWLPRY